MWFFPKHIKKIVKSEKQLKQSNMSIKEQMKGKSTENYFYVLCSHVHMIWRIYFK